MALLDQAKLVFMSLKSNQMFSESELAAWRQRHADHQLQQPITPEGRERGGGGRGVSSRHTAAPPLQPSAATPRKRSAAVETKKKENAHTAGGNTPENQRGRPRGARESKATPTPTTSPPGKKARKAGAAAAAGFNGGGGPVAARRLTYTDDEATADQGWRAIAATPVFQGRHITLSDQLQEQTFRGSLQRFVRHAGLKARVAAEFRTLECVARARHSSPVPPQCWNGGFAPGAGFLPPPPRPPAPEAPPAPECKLETDEVLKLFVLMGTPAAFLGRAKKMFGQDGREEKSAAKEGQPAKAAADDARARAGAVTAAETGHGKKSGASCEPPAAAACGRFAPPKLVPGRLGFGQFAASSARPFKLKSKPSPSTASGKKKL